MQARKAIKVGKEKHKCRQGKVQRQEGKGTKAGKVRYKSRQGKEKMEG
jgi:hypothetical protein